MNIRERLLALGEPAYRDFSASLLPGVEHIIGVRLPALRRLAREIVRSDWRGYLREADDLYFEERMLQGMVIGYAPCGPEEFLRLTAAHLPKIDNWSLCDSFCRRLRPAEREPVWRFIDPLFRAEGEYEVRFAAVTGLNNFTDAEHLDALLGHLGAVRHEGYYARMAVAWAVSVCYAADPDRTGAWLGEGCPLPEWTYGRSLQKILESRRTTAEQRADILRLREASKLRTARR